MPTARAPMPMRRNVADDVPARWPPSEPCACAPAPAHASSTAAAVARAVHRAVRDIESPLEVHIELKPPLRPGSVVRRIAHLRDVHEIVHPADVRGIELAMTPDAAPAGDRIDAVVQIVV